MALKVPKKKITRKKEQEPERVRHNPKTAEIKSGDLMAFVYWCKVKTASPNRLEVRNLDAPMDFEVNGDDLIEKGYSADQYEEMVQVTKTKAAELLVASHNRPLTVCFEKTDGSKRILRGRLVTPEPLLGRSMVEDLDVSDGHRLRLVDHRTIEYLIVEGVKYVVK